MGLPLRKGLQRPQESDLFVLPIRQSLVKDARIMPGTARLILLLAGWSGRPNEICTTLGTIARHLGRSVRQVQRYIKDAAEEGYLFFGYRKHRGYVTGLKIRLNPSAVFAPKRVIRRFRAEQKMLEAQENRATPLKADNNGNYLFYKAKMGDFERGMMKLLQRNGESVRLLE
ncbi:MAG: hypothetical protein AAFQ22_11805 [Pseudomonadota bacterium]